MVRCQASLAPPQPESDAEIQPWRQYLLPIPRRGILQVVWHRRWIVLLCLLACSAGALVYLSKATPIYTSTSRLLVEQRGPRIIHADEGFMTQSNNYLYTQCELLRSTPILSGAADALRRQELRTFGPARNPVAFLKKHLNVSVGKKDDIVSVSMDSPYAEEAAGIVNAVVGSYIAYHSRRQRNTSAEVLRILEREKAKRDVELRERSMAVMEFKRANETISFGTDDSNIIIQRLIKLSDALTSAELDMLEAQGQLQTTAGMLHDPEKRRHLAESRLGPGERSSSQRETSKLLLELAGLRQHYTSEHPLIEEAESKLKQLKQQEEARAEQAAAEHLAILKQKCTAAESHVAELKALLAEQRRLAQELNSKAVQYAMLVSEKGRTERLCNILDSRIKEIDITDDTGALNISILEVAQAGEVPSSPKKARVAGFALALGLLMGVGLALVRDWADHRLQSAEEISQVLGLPVVGVVPHMQRRDTKGRSAGVVADTDPASQAAEAYRTIRTAVYFGVPDCEAKTLLIASPDSADGKSTLASNLAITMAQAGQRVLLLDADLRKPVQHAVFNVGGETAGLIEVLTKQSMLEEAVRETGVDGLDVLPCGTIPPNPSEMLNSEAFRELLEELSRKYDRIVLDGPPVMPVTDARILGAVCDVTLVVLRAVKSTRKPARQAAECLLSVGTRILGVVVNDIPNRKSGYDYYSYGHWFGYGQAYRGGRHKARNKEGEEGTKLLTDVA